MLVLVVGMLGGRRCLRCLVDGLVVNDGWSICLHAWPVALVGRLPCLSVRRDRERDKGYWRRQSIPSLS
jgi:hypothetical protein